MLMSGLCLSGGGLLLRRQPWRDDCLGRDYVWNVGLGPIAIYGMEALGYNIHNVVDDIKHPSDSLSCWST